MRRILIALVISASACESPQVKAQRLRENATLACFDASHANSADQQAHDADPAYKQTPAQRQASVDSLRGVIQARCDVATRELNQFMNGR